MQYELENVWIYAAGFIFAVAFVRVLKKPLFFLLRIALNSLFGGLLMILVNTYGGSLGWHVAVNPVTALISGILGLPGVIMLIILTRLCGL
ncbi:MAG: pro-sigmaK processing inhibitor BofA family protein [Clostridia bacterium]|nr:pro-sigmaK processing inhibitor BofA family protein [Clostridia bacterium]